MIWQKSRRNYRGPTDPNFAVRAYLGACFFLSLALFQLGCGVKGDPLPPEKPAALGRGRPTYKRATEDIQIEKSKRRDPPGGEEIEQETTDEN